MTRADKFKLCHERAAQIVALYRSKAPEGCDPLNTYVALATAVVGAGTAAYSAYSSKKAASKAAGQGIGGQFQPISLPDAPAFIPVDPNKLQSTAVDFDRQAYGLSDKDFSKRHAPLVSAEKLFEAQTLKDQTGDTELMPAVQNEFMRAGLRGALSSFGDSAGTLAPGSAGEASVARNLGVSILGLQDRNRTNRMKSLITAEELFPRRNFGISGSDAAQIGAANVAGMNNWNQAQFANEVQTEQFNATGGANFANSQQAQRNANAQAGAVANAESNKAILSAAEMVAKLGATYAGGKTQAGTTYNTSAAAAAAAPYAGSVSNISGAGWVPRATAVKY